MTVYGYLDSQLILWECEALAFLQQIYWLSTWPWTVMGPYKMLVRYCLSILRRNKSMFVSNNTSFWKLFDSDLVKSILSWRPCQMWNDRTVFVTTFSFKLFECAILVSTSFSLVDGFSFKGHLHIVHSNIFINGE